MSRLGWALSGALAWAGPPAVAAAAHAAARAGDESSQSRAVVVVHMCDAFEDVCWARAEQRLEAELLAAGFSVTTRPGEATDEAARRTELDAFAQDHRALAALRIVRSAARGGVDLWIVDRVTGKTSFRHVSAAEIEGEDAAELVALRTVELLHASFLELAAEHPPRGEIEPPAPVEQLVRPLSAPPAPPLFIARAGLFVAGGPRGLGALAGPTVGMSWGFAPLFRLDLDVWASALHGRVSSEVGDARVGLGAGLVHVAVRPFASARVSPAFGLGGGFLMGWSWGDPAPGYVGRRELVLVGLPSAMGQLAVRLTPRLRLWAGARVGIAVPEIQVRLGGETAGRSGRPLVDGALGLAWTWDPVTEKK